MNKNKEKKASTFDHFDQQEQQSNRKSKAYKDGFYILIVSHEAE